ncbi:MULTISPECIES: TetR family transcriptional regulator [Mycolicibacterium]|uniref:TetR/AcrR family transcriptional regulator n=1 Tax=Mycolicibacterium monacense TaxID=85693 RepID=UPI000325ED66|nr:TetR family transcriptional regulator [Mycolicibacterium monacense]OBB76928.1 TetR family transcriptional regulator [Mycolicibacterium monacense]OBF53454.1 TetR family transcriptional regulator [Mycolicibacterium monacense]
MASPAKTTRRRGRRQGEPVSREVVLAAAKNRFATDGYERTTLRAIAKDAHVDPSMVLYLFGSKLDLFRESLRLILDPERLVEALSEAGGDVGSRMARVYLQIWESPETGPSMVVMLQSATSNSEAHEAFRTFMQTYVLAAVSGVLGGDEHARLRAMLAATTLVGTAVLRYVMKIPPLATIPTEDLVALLAPTVTRYLTADAEELGLPAQSV